MTTEPRRFEPTDRRHEENGTTQDLGGRIRGIARPGPATPPTEWIDRPGVEQHVRTRGKWMIITGVAITLLTAALAIVWEVGNKGEMPLAAVLPLQAVGLGGIAIGLMEYLARPHRRAQQRCLEHVDHCLDRIDHLEVVMLDVVGLMSEELQQQFYQGSAWQARNQFFADTGSENARPINKSGIGGVVPFRPRNGS
jgi:hypothetical protein